MNQNKWDILNTKYINKGLKIFPIIENGKTPLIKEWQNDCSSNFMQCLYWMENARNCNWGLPANENDLFIIDCDVHDPNKNGVENFEKLCYDLNISICETMTQQTPSGGIHLIFKSDDDLKNVSNNSNVFKDYQGIDFRTQGYIVVEPSSINDKKYKFLNNLEPQEIPWQLKDYILNNCEIKDIKKKIEYVKPTIVETGDRDNQLFHYINQLYFKHGLDFDEVFVLAKHFNETILEKPLPEKDVKYKVKKCFEKDRSQYLLLKISDIE